MRDQRRGMALRELRSSLPDLTASSMVAMIASMAVLHSTCFGTRPPRREAIVDQLTQATLHASCIATAEEALCRIARTKIVRISRFRSVPLPSEAATALPRRMPS